MARTSRTAFHVSGPDPNDVFESRSLLDFARLRAARLSASLGRTLIVWQWNEDNGLRRVRAVARAGKVFWYRPCLPCGERGCAACDDLGAVEDDRVPPERPGDAI